MFSKRPSAPEPKLSPKASQFLGLFEDHLVLRYAPRTAEAFHEHLRVFLAWLYERGIELAAVRTQDLDAYSTELFSRRKKDGKPYAVGVLSHRIMAVRTLFRFLYRRGYLLHDPAAVLELPRGENRLPRVILTYAEARRIVEAPDETVSGLRDRAILETLYATGVRVTELIRLGVDDVDAEERALRIVLGKGRKDRVVPLTRAAAEAIEVYLTLARPKLVGCRTYVNLFLGGFGFPLRRDGISAIIARWARKARIKKKVTAHTFRHTVATHLLRGRADIRHIQVLLGHESLETTQRYTRVEITDLRRVMARSHPRGK